MFIDASSNQFNVVKSHLSIITQPVYWCANIPQKWQYAFNHYMATRINMQDKIASLEDKLLSANGRLQQFNSVVIENNRLRALLNSTSRLQDNYFVAEIIRIDTDPFSKQVIINRGRNDDLYVGQPMLDENGLIGTIIETNQVTSRATLLTDIGHAVPIENSRNGTRAIATGQGNSSSITLQHVPVTADFRENDILVTSGLGGRYPAGYPVGVVKHKKCDEGASFMVVTIEPIAKTEQVRQVLLVKNKQKVRVNSDS